MVVEDPITASKFDDSMPASSHGCGGCCTEIQMLSEAAQIFMAKKVLIAVSTFSAAA